ncbi:transposase [bacterium]|nr:transposase [bacterium]
MANSKGILVPAKTLFRMLKAGEYIVLEGPRFVLGVKLFVIGMRLLDGEYLILVSDKEPETALDHYKQHWEIETLFGCLKTRGFDFESTHMTAPDRIQKLVALLALAYCWCIITGEWLNSLKEIKVKKHGRKAISIFRYGLDELREILLNISERYNDYKEKVNQFFKALPASLRLRNKSTPDGSNFLSWT